MTNQGKKLLLTTGRVGEGLMIIDKRQKREKGMQMRRGFGDKPLFFQTNAFMDRKNKIT